VGVITPTLSTPAAKRPASRRTEREPFRCSVGFVPPLASFLRFEIRELDCLALEIRELDRLDSPVPRAEW